MKKGKKILRLCGFQKKMEMIVPVSPISAYLLDIYWCNMVQLFILWQAHETLTSDKVPDAKLHLSLPQMITFLGKTEIKVDVNVVGNLR